MSSELMSVAPAGEFAELRVDRVIDTVQQLERRIGERFPDAGLRRVAAQLLLVARETERDAPRLRGPIWPLRLATAIGIVLLVAATVWLTARLLQVSLDPGNVSEALQGSEAALNDVIFLSVAIFFLGSLEIRVKRKRALRALHRLRTIVHIVDMHQLTKDPESVAERVDTPSSPERTLGRYALSRYLDYCSELLSLSSKVAALHVQYVNDPVVLDAVNDIETLAAALSNKIWQKIMILDSVRA